MQYLSHHFFAAQAAQETPYASVNLACQAQSMHPL